MRRLRRWKEGPVRRTKGARTATMESRKTRRRCKSKCNQGMSVISIKEGGMLIFLVEKR